MMVGDTDRCPWKPVANLSRPIDADGPGAQAQPEPLRRVWRRNMQYFFSQRAFEEANKHEVLDRIERWSSNNIEFASDEEATILLSHKKFGKKYPVLKLRSKNFRIVGIDTEIGGRKVLVWLRILNRSSSECSAFYDDPLGWGQKNLDPILEKEREEIAKRLANNIQDQALNTEPLPEHLLAWLNPPSILSRSQDGNMTIFYESRHWVSRFNDRQIQNFWKYFYDLLVKMVDERSSSEYRHGVILEHVGDYHILAIRLDARGFTAGEYILLLSPFLREPSEDDIKYLLNSAQDTINIFNNDKISLDERIDAIASFSARSYTEIALYDEKIWQKIASNTEGNLALSAEELNLLAKLAKGPHDGIGMPLFINGQAGSGKSTMLAHAFASYCHRKHVEKLEGQPIFLTMNEKLLDYSKKAVSQLLKSKPKYIEVDIDDIDDIDIYFKTLKKLLLDALEANGMLDVPEISNHSPLFADKDHINFSRFRAAYLGDSKEIRGPHLHAGSKIPPELAWFVIRTYIKGYSELDFLTPQKYAELPHKERLITQEAYEYIYKNIWQKWYKPLNEKHGKWDDQDLVRKVLRDADELPSYPIIFCDESQDFTRIELKLILKLSEMVKYQHKSVESIPYIFAGDPLQTVNPSGFRWASLKTSFYDVIKKISKNASHINLQPAELRRNYRSLPPIVGLLNHIQAWRSALFGLNQLQPQLPWGQDVEHSPALPTVYFVDEDIDSRTLSEAIQENSYILLIPADEGGDEEFVYEDNLLKRIVDPNKNIFTAIGVKGLEFDNVILYKFGDKAPKDLFKQQVDEATRMVSEHFFNKLYVAASRAKKQLVIFDTHEGYEKLWSNFVDFGSDLIKMLHNASIWRRYIDPIMAGKIAEFSSEVEAADPREIAHSLFEQGMLDQDPSLLRRAATWYNHIGDRKQARLCEAHALRFENSYVESGRMFIELGKINEASNVLWDGFHWKELAALYSNNDLGKDLHRAAIASYLSDQRPELRRLQAFIQDISAWLRSGGVPDAIAPQWKQVIKRLAKDMDRFANIRQKAALQPVYEVLLTLRERGLMGISAALAKCAFALGDWKRAISEWEFLDDTNHKRYWQAISHTVSEPSNIEYLARAQDFAAILEVWERHQDIRDPSLLRYVAQAMEHQKRRADAVEVYLRMGDLSRAMAAYSRLGSSIPLQHKTKLTDLLLKETLRRGIWDDAVALFARRRDMPADEEHRRLLSAWFYGALLAHKPDWSDLRQSTRDIEGFIREDMEAGRLGPPLLNELQVGEVLERYHSRIVEALRYYGKLVNERGQIGAQARRRWLAVKLRHARWEESRGRGAAFAEDKFDDARMRAKEWRIDDLDAIPEYPLNEIDLETLLEGGTRASKPLPNTIKLIHRERSVRLLHTDTGDRLDIDLDRPFITGDDISVERHRSTIHFRAPQMGISGKLFERDGKRVLELHVEGELFEIPL